MNPRSKYKTLNYKVFKENIGENFLDMKLSRVLRYATKGIFHKRNKLINGLI